MLGFHRSFQRVVLSYFSSVSIPGEVWQRTKTQSIVEIVNRFKLSLARDKTPCFYVYLSFEGVVGEAINNINFLQIGFQYFSPLDLLRI